MLPLFKIKYSFLIEISEDVNKFNKLKTQIKHKRKKTNVHDTTSKLCNNFLEIHYDEYSELSDDKKIKWILNMIIKIYLLKDILVVCGKK